MRFKLRLTFISRTIAQINALRLANSIGGGEECVFIRIGIGRGNVLKYWNPRESLTRVFKPILIKIK